VVSETVGKGRRAKEGDVVTIAYRAALPDGSTLLEDDEFVFRLGAEAVIAGVDEGVAGMRTGGKRVVECPPHKHWGRAGYGNGAVPPDTPLTLYLRLLDID